MFSASQHIWKLTCILSTLWLSVEATTIVRFCNVHAEKTQKYNLKITGISKGKELIKTNSEWYNGGKII